MQLKTLLGGALLAAMAQAAGQSPAPMPAGPLTFGGFSARFGADGAFSLEGQGWPPFKGTWKQQGREIELLTGGDTAGGCDQAGRYRVTPGATNGHLALDLVSDAC